MPTTERTHEDVWDEFWAPLVTNDDGSLNLDQIKRELAEWHFAMGEVSKVYAHVTGDLLSKPLYHASGVISAADERTESLLAEARAEAASGVVPLRLAQHLASELIPVFRSCCLSDGRSRCPEKAAAIRWEDGFADVVCVRHAETAVERGAVVVFPARHDGTNEPAARAERADTEAVSEL